MCYYTSVNLKQLDFIRKYNLPNHHIPVPIPAPVVNGFRFPKMNVITAPSTVESLQWGLIPYWVKHAVQAKEIRTKTLNARWDSLREKPSFRSAFKSRRCLIPVSGFFEWRALSKHKYPYYIQHASQSIFSLAGIHESWTDQETGEYVRSFAIVTAEANPFMARIHNTKLRMPFILDEESETIWLKSGELSETESAMLLEKVHTVPLKAYPVGKGIQQAGDHTSSEMLNEAHYPELLFDPI